LNLADGQGRMTEPGSVSALLVTTLVYSVSITAFVLMALTLAIDARGALDGMAAFLAGFLLTRSISAPPIVQFIVPLVVGAGIFVHRAHIVQDGLTEGVLGRSVGKRMVGLLSVVSLVSGLFISVVFYRSGAMGRVMTDSGTARGIIIVLLELGPVIVGLLGFGMVYIADR